MKFNQDSDKWEPEPKEYRYGASTIIGIIICLGLILWLCLTNH